MRGWNRRGIFSWGRRSGCAKHAVLCCAALRTGENGSCGIGIRNRFCRAMAGEERLPVKYCLPRGLRAAFRAECGCTVFCRGMLAFVRRTKRGVGWRMAPLRPNELLFFRTGQPQPFGLCCSVKANAQAAAEYCAPCPRTKSLTNRIGCGTIPQGILCSGTRPAYSHIIHPPRGKGAF